MVRGRNITLRQSQISFFIAVEDFDPELILDNIDFGTKKSVTAIRREYGSKIQAKPQMEH
jgi:hypothetical protein